MTPAADLASPPMVESELDLLQLKACQKFEAKVVGDYASGNRSRRRLRQVQSRNQILGHFVQDGQTAPAWVSNFALTVATVIAASIRKRDAIQCDHEQYLGSEVDVLPDSDNT